jgi:hypothetical protein
MKTTTAIALVGSALLLAGCGASGPATMAPLQSSAPRAMAAKAGEEVATPAMIARLMAGHRAYQGRTVVGPDNQDAAFLTSYDGKKILLDGTFNASKSNTLLGLVKYVSSSVTLETGEKVAFVTQEFFTNASADKLLGTLPLGKKGRFTASVHRFSYRSNANSPFVYEAR